MKYPNLYAPEVLLITHSTRNLGKGGEFCHHVALMCLCGIQSLSACLSFPVRPLCASFISSSVSSSSSVVVVVVVVVAVVVVVVVVSLNDADKTLLFLLSTLLFAIIKTGA